jgi:hypothetical protein
VFGGKLAEFGLAVCFGGILFGGLVCRFWFGGFVWRFLVHLDFILDFLLTSLLSSRDRFYRFTSEHQ